jgi:hypothetical protein
VLRTLAIIAAATILIANLLAIGGLSGRPLHYDENEYLHASWLMAAGETIYRDFFEDHPPHFFVMLHSVVPGGDLRAIDVEQWTIGARWLTGLFGTIAACAVMLFAWRVTRSPAAPVVAGAALLASAQIWSRGLTDIRAEGPSLALFWVGVVLLTWSVDGSRVQALRAGTGIGLLFFAAVMNPKWPLESLLLGGYYLHFVWRARRWFVAAVAPAVAIALVALLPLVTLTTPREYLFFNYQLKAAVVGDFTANPWIVDFFTRNPVWSTTSWWYRWYVVVGALVVASAGVISRRRVSPALTAPHPEPLPVPGRGDWEEPSSQSLLPSARGESGPAKAGPDEGSVASVPGWLALALAVSALLEFRFFYPYPYLWAQYLVMIATTAAVVYGMVAALLPRRVQALVIVVVTIAAMVPLGRRAQSVFQDRPASWSRYWAMQRTLQRADRVWISPPRHPVATYDASYYWYNFRESAPSAIRLQSRFPEFLPPISFRNLPPCTLQGVQYVELGDWMPFLDDVCRCAETAYRGGRLTPAEPLGIFAVDSSQPPAAWGARTRDLWSDLCRRQEVFLRGGQLNISP